VSKNGALPLRSEIEHAYKWRLEDLYSDDAAWERDFECLDGLLKAVKKYEGKLGDSAEALLLALQARDELMQTVERIYAYARMRKDEDNSNPTYQALTDRAQNMAVKAESAVSYLVPEILGIPENRIKGYLQESRELQVYRHHLDDILRYKPHTLPPEEERLLAEAGEIAAAPANIFTMINDADISFPTVRDENGQEIELTKGRYIKFLRSSDRRLRREAFEKLYDTYAAQKNTLATTLVSSLKKDAFFARAHKYDSAQEQALFTDNVSETVYDNLIASVRDHLDLMYRYIELRKRMLGLDELHMYDLYAPLVPDANMEFTYEDALDYVRNGLQPLGEEYLSILDTGFKSSWIDVYESKGKTSGAYSWGAYGCHPFVLLNFQGDVNDVFTIAHEMGHALHSYHSQAAQPYVYAGYSIFVAEVASTVNENLLMTHLLDTIDDRMQRIYLLNHYLEEFRSTIYRQTMFAEFEKIVHEKIDAGQPLTAGDLCDIYYKLNKEYFGPGVVVDDRIAMEWARIPHFYRAFYVYKYATGFSAAVALSEKILAEGEPAVKAYINFLSSGSSDYPVNQLRVAGVDMSKREPIDKALSVFHGVLDEIQDLTQHPQ